MALRDQRKHGEAVSPQINSRLFRRYPPGSDGALLARDLVAQGFKLVGSCPNEPLVRIARFSGYAGGLFNTNATVYWKLNADDDVEWTKGFVWFDGL